MKETRYFYHMNNPLFIPLLLGSAREGRASENVARYVHGLAQKNEKFKTELLDVRDFVAQAKTQAMPEDRAKRWSETMRRADGLIIISPEYNHSFPGELKLMLDQLYKEYHYKPAGICGVSAGGLGGARMVEALRLVLIELHMTNVREAVYFLKAKELFDESGAITDPSYEERLTKLFDEMVWYADALKKARECCS
jgi:NAD(P)H-dependent FMN reductase